MKALLQYKLIGVLLLAGCIFACRKSEPTIQTPLIDEGASISMTQPADSARFSPGQTINISGKVTGSQNDYSFLNYYVLSSAGHDTLATGGVHVDGSIDAVIQRNLLPGQYHIYLKAVNKSPDIKTLSSASRLIIVDAHPLTLPGHALPFFDQQRNRIYYYSPDSSNLLLTIDPDLLTVENATDIGYDKELLGIDETGNNLNLVIQQASAADSGQLFKFDLMTHTLKPQGKFHNPNGYPIIAVSNNFLFYTQFQIIWYDDMSTGSSFNTLLHKAFVWPAQAFNNNGDLLIHFSSNREDPADSFYVYHVSPGSIQLTFMGASPGTASFVQKVLPFTAGLVGDGPNLYDQSFQLQGSLPGNDFISGISQDEKYVSSSSGPVYRISDWSVADSLGSGLYIPYVFFKTDGSKVYPVTAPSLLSNSYKIYSYPWGK